MEVQPPLVLQKPEPGLLAQSSGLSFLVAALILAMFLPAAVGFAFSDCDLPHLHYRR